MTSRYKPVGWKGESYRHYLAAKGIKTRYNAVRGGSFSESFFRASDQTRARRISSGTTLPRLQQAAYKDFTDLYSPSEIEELRRKSAREGGLSSQESEKVKRSIQFQEDLRRGVRESEIMTQRPSVARALQEQRLDEGILRKLGFSEKAVETLNPRYESITNEKLDLQNLRVTQKEADALISDRLDELDTRISISKSQRHSPNPVDVKKAELYKRALDELRRGSASKVSGTSRSAVAKKMVREKSSRGVM